MTTLVISSRQIRAARGLLGWTQEQLAQAAGISRSTLAAIEKDAGNPTIDIIARIRTVLEGKQVEFLSQEGVRLREPTIYYDDNPGANRRLLEEVYIAASRHRQKTGVNDILIFGVREEDVEESVGSYLNEHIAKLQAAGLEEKILCSPAAKAFIAPEAWYRRLPKFDLPSNPIPVMAFGEKLAAIEWEPKETITVVDSKPFSDVFRFMFRHIWDSRRGR